MKDISLIKDEIRKHEDNFKSIFCETFDFSKVFKKNKDDLITLMYDHHQFITKNTNIKASDLQEAITYQKEHNCNYLKIDSRFKLPKELITSFKLEESTTLTMVNFQSNQALSKHFTINPNVVIKDVQVEDIEQDILKADLKNYEASYGREFVEQYVKTFCLKARNDKRLHYLGAYLNNELCGYCYYFDDGNYKVLDGLTVNEESRHQYVASSLISYIINTSNSIMYLHADKNDTPQKMYRKMGFEDIDVLYEYMKIGLNQD